MKTVYLLWEINDRFYEDFHQTMVGVYATRELAEAAAKYPLIEDTLTQRMRQPWSSYVGEVQVIGS